ncbi:DNA methyltransferase [Bacillus pumilus]|uniref:DNA methyltransferase n=1 Tax=Bacillus pumilus TaxID=1408 RepID=UPI00203F1F7C|nr:DNA methyltransferase [Bacillus pumilus]MCM3150280.1 site-specific DNA-methyltransferase [Bacillus pumilus]
MELNQIIQGDCIKVVQSLPPDTIQTVITSPPYWGLRDYGMTEQIGLEATVQEYIQKIVSLFREIKRVLKDDGTVWLNLGDAYAGSGRGRIANGQAHPGIEHKQSVGQRSGVINLSNKIAGLKPKDLIGLPWRVAFALQEDGWYLRKDIVWNKPNAMPESVRYSGTQA